MIKTYSGTVEKIEEEITIRDSNDAPSKRNPTLIQKLYLYNAQGVITLINTDFFFTEGETVVVEYNLDDHNVIKKHKKTSNFLTKDRPLPLLAIFLGSLLLYAYFFLIYFTLKTSDVAFFYNSFIINFITTIKTTLIIASYPLSVLFIFILNRVIYYSKKYARKY